MFFAVSGGPYGLEPLFHNVGGTAALALIVITPLVWSLPVILMTLELNGLMPREGGYYYWVKSALGRQWGFCEGWWSWLYALTDLAIYPVLFTQYLTYLIPEASAYKIPICLAVIWLCVQLNLRGVLLVGRSSITLGIAVLVPFLILFAVAAVHPSHLQETLPHTSPLMPIGLAALCMGLFNVMWNYLGWDNGFTIAEEVESPVRSYLIAIGGAMLVIVLIYFFSVLVAVQSGIDPGLLEEEGFPSLGLRLGGWWVGAVLSAGGMASALGLFLAALLSISRVPKVMADDGLLPSRLQRLHPVTQVPHVSILTCAVVVSFMVLWDFGDLLIIDVTLYGAALLPEFFALVILRRRIPDSARPFRIPLKIRGLVFMTCFPAACILLALGGLFASGTVHLNAAWFALVIVATGPLVWQVVKRRRVVEGM